MKNILHKLDLTELEVDKIENVFKYVEENNFLGWEQLSYIEDLKWVFDEARQNPVLALELVNYLAKTDSEEWYVIKSKLANLLVSDDTVKCWVNDDGVVSFYTPESGTVCVHDPLGEIGLENVEVSNLPWSNLPRQFQVRNYLADERTLRLVAKATEPGRVNSEHAVTALERLMDDGVRTPVSGVVKTDLFLKLREYKPTCAGSTINKFVANYYEPERVVCNYNYLGDKEDIARVSVTMYLTGAAKDSVEYGYHTF